MNEHDAAQAVQVWFQVDKQGGEREEHGWEDGLGCTESKNYFCNENMKLPARTEAQQGQHSYKYKRMITLGSPNAT